MIYIVCFFISCFFIALSEKNKNNKFIHCTCVTIGLLLPCILAGLRDFTIGTDVQVYVKPIFECAKKSESFSEYLNMNVNTIKIVSDFEIGFSLFVYVITKLFANLQILFFFIELLIVIPIYLGLTKIEKSEKSKIWLGMLVFYLMFFNMSLNIMRQYISISIFFWGICCVLSNEKNKNLKCILSIIIAFFFHSSALLGLIIYLIYIVVNHKYKKTIKIFKYTISINKILGFIIILIGICIIANTKVIINLLGDLGMEYYSRYINGKVTLFMSAIIRILPIVCIFAISRKSFRNKYINAETYILIFIYSIIILQLTTINVFAARIALIFSIFNVVSFPRLCTSFCNKDSNIILTTFLIIYLLLYWYYYYVYGGGSETIPYKFFYISVNID